MHNTKIYNIFIVDKMIIIHSFIDIIYITGIKNIKI